MDHPWIQAGVCLPKPMRAFFAFRRGLAAALLPVMPVCLLTLFVSAAVSARSWAENPRESSAVPAAAPVQTRSEAPAAPATTAQDPAKPSQLAAPPGPPSDLVNRQALEQHAGKNACKLLLRSTPSKAQVFVDGAFVGNSPLELVVAPGKYQIEMRGQRLDSARRQVDLLPRETREVALPLTARYPTRVTAQ
jgi:hypothetical protein